MYLKSLTIKDQSGSIIRHVDFKMGLNIIKGDVTHSADASTNSIGKTTLLRSIDFCLAGKWQTLVNDKELKSNRNNTVFDFFKKTSPNFELIIAKSLKEPASSQIKINRILTIGTDKKDKETVSVKNWIDDNEVSNDDFQNQLKHYLFGLDDTKPTFRQLIPKFVRASDYQVSNIVRYLHSSTPNATYEVLQLSLFGFHKMSLVHQRVSTEEDLKQKIAQVDSLKNLVATGAEEAHNLRASQLEKLQQQYDTYKISTDYERESDQLNLLKESLEQIRARITNHHLDRDVWESRLKEISSENQKISVEAVKYMYQEAELYNVELHKKFEETLVFHQTMLKNEVDYIHTALQRVRDNITTLEHQYKIQADSYNKLLNKLAESGSLADYTALGNQINALTKEIAESEAILSSYNAAINAQNKLKAEFETLTLQLDTELKEFQSKLTIFNQYFSEYSKALSKDGYLLAITTDKNGHFILTPTPVDGDGHVGDGHKQSVIIAFDLAYAAYINHPTVGVIAPHFFTQDKVEIIDGNVLSKLIKLIEDTECQFIFPIIKDKLDTTSNFDEKDIILALDADNKFFNIENHIVSNTLFQD